MKQWQETAAVLGDLTRLWQAGARAALATVIAIRGSAYRRPGAKLLIPELGATRGSVSGGCLEADVAEIARGVLRERRPRLRHYETGADDREVFGLGLGCNGAVDVFISPTDDLGLRAAAARVLALLAADEPFAVSTMLTGEAAGRVVVWGPGEPTGPGDFDRDLARAAGALVTDGGSAVHEIQGQRVFTEVLRPPQRLVVFGAGDDAVPLATLATTAGFRVIVVDHRSAHLDTSRYEGGVHLVERRPDGALDGLGLGPHALAVVKTHSLAHDREWVRRLLASDVAYIGLLGPRARVHDVLEQTGAGADPRVFGPVGLDLGADGPEQVALSVVAELLAVTSRRAPRHLREREEPIHAP